MRWFISMLTGGVARQCAQYKKKVGKKERREGWCEVFIGVRVVERGGGGGGETRKR